MQDLTTQSLSTTDLTNGANLNLGIDTGLISTIMMVGTIISIILTLVIVIYLIVNIAHRWRSEKAMVEMAKNVQDIKMLLEKQIAEKTAEKMPVTPAVQAAEQLGQQGE